MVATLYAPTNVCAKALILIAGNVEVSSTPTKLSVRDIVL